MFPTLRCHCVLGVEISPEHHADVKVLWGIPVTPGHFKCAPQLLFALPLSVSHCLQHALVGSSVGLTHPSRRRVLCPVGLTAY